MFLKNFWEFIRCNAFGGKDFQKSSYVNYPCNIRATNCDNVDYIFVSSMPNPNTPVYYPNTPGFSSCTLYGTHPFYAFTAVVGTGSTAVTPDDYKLDNDVTSRFTTTSTTMNYSVNESGHLVVTITWNALNTSGIETTITEIGAVRKMNKRVSDSDSNATYADVLVFRHVLTTPITIGPNASADIVVECELY